MNDESKLKGKLSSEDEETLNEAIKDGQSFLDSNAEAEKEEYDEKRKEIEGICDPIIKRVMDSGAGGAGEAEKGEDDEDFEDEF
jgi:hypothetical protein